MSFDLNLMVGRIERMKNHPTMLVLVGMPGAGKSSCVEYLETKGIPNAYFGGVVVNEVKKRYGDDGVTPAREKLVREEFREVEGKGAIAKRIIPQLDHLLKTHPRVVADGLYSWAEYKIFKEYYGNKVLIVAITAPRHVRHQRLAHRPIRPLTEVEVTAREYAEIENIEKGGPIANADYTLTNDGDAAQMLQNLDNLLLDTGFYDPRV
jgi:dephospho-CoA kinase